MKIVGELIYDEKDIELLERMLEWIHISEDFMSTKDWEDQDRDEAQLKKLIERMKTPQ